MRILLIEQNRNIVKRVADTLSDIGAIIDIVSDSGCVVEQVKAEYYHGIILSNHMINLDAIKMVKLIRRLGIQAPIIMMGHKFPELMIYQGLIAGVNDFLETTFTSQQLIMRLRITMSNCSMKPLDYYIMNQFQFYPSSYKLMSEDGEIKLTKKECEILKLLVTNSNNPISKAEILEQVWVDHETVNESIVEVYISKLRKIMKNNNVGINIKSVRNVGYCLC